VSKLRRRKVKIQFRFHLFESENCVPFDEHFGVGRVRSESENVTFELTRVLIKLGKFLCVLVQVFQRQARSAITNKKAHEKKRQTNERK
jgi:hypothetical protein